MSDAVSLDLKELLGGLDEPAWEDYPGAAGLAVHLRVPEAPEMLVITSRVLRGESGDDLADLRLSDAQTADLQLSRARLAVMGWRGLSAAALQELLPGQTLNWQGTEPPAELPFSPELRDLLLRRSKAFFLWVTTWIMRREGFLKDAEKNSSATPGTTPTRTPAPAAGAARKKQRSA